MKIYTSIFKSYVYLISLSKLILIWLIKSFYFDFVLTNCPSDIIHYFLTDPLQVCLYPPVIKCVNWKSFIQGWSSPSTLKIWLAPFLPGLSLKYFFPNPAFLANPQFSCIIYSATTASFFILFFTSLLPTTYIKILLNFIDVEHKVLELKKWKVHNFFKKIDNNYVIGWYFFSVVYITKDIYSMWEKSNLGRKN